MAALMTSGTRSRAESGTQPPSSAATTSAAFRLAGMLTLDRSGEIHRGSPAKVTRPRRASSTSASELKASAIATA